MHHQLDDVDCGSVNNNEAKFLQSDSTFGEDFRCVCWIECSMERDVIRLYAESMFLEVNLQ